MKMQSFLFCLLALGTPLVVFSFSISVERRPERCHVVLSATQSDHEVESAPNSFNRRKLLGYSSSLALASMLAPSPASSDTSTVESAVSSALQDLPPVPTDYCRLYFIRHGQTENNRKRLVQGARVNIPINELGQQQGRRAGVALANADPTPSLIYYSPLMRAQQTAEEAKKEGKMKANLKVLDALMEVDFGPVAEGQLIEQAKPDMMATYARWSMGNVDFRPEGGGDSARDVLDRAVEAVNAMTKAATSDECPNRCVAAFTHSQYLRMLLALFLGDTLAQGANLKTNNGSINVIDVSLTGETTTIGSKSKLVGGFLSQAPKDFQLEIPRANVVRVNECRHLEGL